MEQTAVRLEFQPFGWTVEFAGCEDVAADIERLLRGWSPRRHDPDDPAVPKPAARILRQPNGNHLWEDLGRGAPHCWDNDKANTHFHAICDTIDIFFDWFLEDRPDYLCLHGAAVRFGEALVCFPSVKKAGKSTLCVELAALGHSIVCDDVLPLEKNTNLGFALGLPIRVRLPIPDDVSERFHALMRARPGPESSGWRYLGLGADELTPLGATAPVAAFVLLGRDAQATPSMERISQQEMMIEVVQQNFATDMPAIEILDRLIDVTGRADCYRLSYDRAENAAKLLIAEFGAAEAGGFQPAAGASPRG